MLSESQKAFFWEHGYLVVEDAVSAEQLEQLKHTFSNWVEDSRQHDSAYGTLSDGRPRFDLEHGHNADQPALRRVSSPEEISPHYYDVMADSGVTDAVADLIGPDVKLHHSKINSKLPKSATVVKWHQDFPFTPHSNDDLITALLMVDEVTMENGPLEVWPGTHKGTIHSLWHEGQFTGAVDDAVTSEALEKRIYCTGKAGSVCLMHTRLLHGSSQNQSDAPRTLYITVYSTADAAPLTPSPVPSEHMGVVVRGTDKGQIRSVPFDVERPELPKGASFFVQQKQHEPDHA
jgi:ectoine hydroxylase-related dioxygenase (phytanoyl-CoA dioxygenase family)